jgi:predicted esterase
MPLEVLEAQTGDNPTATILIMHGLGADGRDFLPIAEQLDLSSVGPMCVSCSRARRPFPSPSTAATSCRPGTTCWAPTW